MFSNIRLHRVVALIVLICAGAWIATGKFAAVGSNQANAEAAKMADPAVEPAVILRTVAGMTPVFAEHARKISLSGVTAPDKSATLAARSTGVVASLDLAKGQLVTQGSVVMQLEGPEAVANAEIAQIALDQRERDLALAERLFKGGNTPETQVTNARSARDAAAAQLTLAKATVDRLQLKVPFSGTVDSVEVEAGEWVQMGATIATILTLDPILVKAEVSELDVGQVEIGSAAQVTLVSGKKLDGTVQFVAREASSATRTFPVEIAFSNTDKTIPAGMTAKVEILAKPVVAVTVPRSIITLSDQGEIGLRIVGADNIAQFAAIQVLDDTPEGLVVTGVPQGVRIVVAGQDLVRNGDQVVVDEAAAVAQP